MYCQTSSSVQFESGNTRMLSPLCFLRVVEIPQLRPLPFRVPAMLRRSRNEKMRSFARDFSSSRRAPPNAASNRYLSSACRSACVFMTSVWTCRAVRERVDAALHALADWYARSARDRDASPLSRNAIMSRNFHVVSTCSSGNGGLAGIERLHREVQHHRAVLADRIQHHRLVALRNDLAHDVDALGLQPLKMGQACRLRDLCLLGFHAFNQSVMLGATDDSNTVDTVRPSITFGRVGKSSEPTGHVATGHPTRASELVRLAFEAQHAARSRR